MFPLFLPFSLFTQTPHRPAQATSHRNLFTHTFTPVVILTEESSVPTSKDMYSMPSTSREHLLEDRKNPFILRLHLPTTHVPESFLSYFSKVTQDILWDSTSGGKLTLDLRSAFLNHQFMSRTLFIIISSWASSKISSGTEYGLSHTLAFQMTF